MNKLVMGKWVLRDFGGERNIIKDGAVYVEGEIIRDIGKYKDLSRKYDYELEIGSSRHIVMPGLINAHHHGRGLSNTQMGIMDKPLEIWLRSQLLSQPRVDTYYDTLLSCIKLIESGVTCTLVHFYGAYYPEYEKALENALKGCIDSGIRVAFAPAVADQYGFVYADEEKFMSRLPRELRDKIKFIRKYSVDTKLYFDAFDRLFDKYEGYRDRVKLLFGPSGVQWCSDDLMQEIKNKASKYGTGIHLHLLETKYQREYGTRIYGKTLVQHLVELDFLGPEVSCAHCVWLTDEDINVFAESEAIAVHNPSSNLRFFSGTAPILKMKEKGARVALGIDGLGINDDEDMFQELRICSMIHRTPGITSRTLTSNEIFNMATMEGANATRFKDVGTLQVGSKADLILVNMERMFSSYMNPRTSVTDILLNCAKGSDVDTVMINGEIVLENKHFVNIDKKRVLEGIRTSIEEVDAETVKHLEKLGGYIKDFYEDWDQEYEI